MGKLRKIKEATRERIEKIEEAIRKVDDYEVPGKYTNILKEIVAFIDGLEEGLRMAVRIMERNNFRDSLK